MAGLRLHLSRYRWPAALLCLLVLALRLGVPIGYMPTLHDGELTLAFCPDAVATPMAAMTGMSGMTAHDDLAAPEHHAPGGDRHAACPFAAAALPVLVGLAVVLLGSAPTLDAEAAEHPRRLRPPITRPRLRPPGRAPPIRA